MNLNVIIPEPESTLPVADIKVGDVLTFVHMDHNNEMIVESIYEAYGTTYAQLQSTLNSFGFGCPVKQIRLAE